MLISLALGAAAPLIWANASIWLALKFNKPLLQWLWESFGVRGQSSFLLVTAVQSLIFGALFAVVIRCATCRPSLLPVLAFLLAFVVSFFLPALIQSPGEAVQTLPVTGLSVGGVLVFTALFSAVLQKLPRQNVATQVSRAK